MPTSVSIVKRVIGRGGAYSATSGARIVKNRAIKLQQPKAVAQKSVGKTSIVQMYAIRNPPEMPPFAIIIKNGIKL